MAGHVACMGEKRGVYRVLVVEVRECLLLFGAESFVFQFAVQKFKD